MHLQSGFARKGRLCLLSQNALQKGAQRPVKRGFSGLWDDGRYEGRNIYNGINEGGLSAILGGPRGLLLTESMEDGLRGPVAQAYEMIGRPEDVSIGRMH